ncbi:DoxX family protein [Thermocoleostomius sinensis]|uniref:DoxX family protein n=1 Tax=Thermocoleostomius sinensis A174 TaxID=2016057 RepID=A0A9E8ZI60_9CYAN|nr:DoxX family protein [Thermocoleostomius sinensis]WAL62157.1 DoxX family protein [Thermocoleostomius sinensis A174]
MTVTQDTDSVLSNIPFLIRSLKFTQSENVWFQLTWTLLRVGVGLLMIHNGLDKLADVQKFADGVVSFIGLPYPVFFTYCAAYVELVGAILLAVGLLTRFNAAALFATMLIAIYFHLKGNGLQVAPLEMASLYALCFLLFLVNGGGRLTIDARLLQWLTKAE